MQTHLKLRFIRVISSPAESGLQDHSSLQAFFLNNSGNSKWGKLENLPFQLVHTSLEYKVATRIIATPAKLLDYFVIQYILSVHWQVKPDTTKNSV